MQPEAQKHATGAHKTVDEAMSDDDLSLARYLIFTIGTELYGSPLVGIKEVIKHAKVNAVPYMANHFKGIINLRGQIIGIVDLRSRFGVTTTSQNQDKGLILVTENDGQTMGVIVDDVISVAAIIPSDIEENPALITKIPMDFFLGIGKYGDRLVNLIGLGACLTADDYAAIQRNREALWKREA